jgi:hypothetical protein
MTTYNTEDEAIKAAKANAELEGFVDFDGKNCDDCVGWDGESRRCDCGNRRVYWETSKNSDGKFYAYAVAY